MSDSTMIHRIVAAGRENESASYFELPVSRTCVQNMIRNGEHSGDVFDSPVSKLIRKFLRKRKDRHIAELEAERDKLRDALQVASEMLSEITSDAERLYYRKTIDAIIAALEAEG